MHPQVLGRAGREEREHGKTAGGDRTRRRGGPDLGEDLAGRGGYGTRAFPSLSKIGRIECRLRQACIFWQRERDFRLLGGLDAVEMMYRFQGP